MQRFQMKPHTFNLVVSLPHDALTPEAYLKAIHAAGCLDVTLGPGFDNELALLFYRHDLSPTLAYESAARDVVHALVQSGLMKTITDGVEVEFAIQLQFRDVALGKCTFELPDELPLVDMDLIIQGGT